MWIGGFLPDLSRSIFWLIDAHLWSLIDIWSIRKESVTIQILRSLASRCKFQCSRWTEVHISIKIILFWVCVTYFERPLFNLSIITFPFVMVNITAGSFSLFACQTITGSNSYFQTMYYRYGLRDGGSGGAGAIPGTWLNMTAYLRTPLDYLLTENTLT